jgi:hypothetical protein
LTAGFEIWLNKLAMKNAKIFISVLLTCGLLFLSSFSASQGPLSLIRIPKGPDFSVRILSRLQVDVRQELGSCLLALADRVDIALLRRNGVRFTVLDRSMVRRDYFLVRLDAPSAITALRAAGSAVAVEPGTAVFWTETGSPSETVPAGLPRKALSSRTVRMDVRPAASAGRPAPQAVAQDPLVETIVSLVSSPDLSSNVQSLQDFQTRYASTSNCEASGQYIYNIFSGLGLDDVRFAPFTFSGSYSSRNVVAEKTGETYPDDILVICSHYDSTSPSRLTLAPGADDNASGTAAVLEAARVLAAFPLDFTVRFVAFSAEEWGLYGSRAYAAAARQAGENIVGVINVDMIAFADALPEDLQIIVNPASAWLADRFLDAAANYGVLGATKTVDASLVYSDHAPFWDSGYPALLAIEDNPLRNPYYHQTTDMLDKINLDFFTSATRASLGLLAELAQPVKEGHPGTPVGLSATSVVYSSLFSALKAVRLTWSAQADAAGYNVYRTNSSHLDYVKVNDSPVVGTTYSDDDVRTDLPYYYVVTAVGGTGLESNRSKEAGVAPDLFQAMAALRTLRPLLFGGGR